jgi:Tol biopolymer transport system component
VLAGSVNGIYVVALASGHGERFRRITSGNDGGPAWSPAGREIAFVRYGRFTRPDRLLVARSDGRQARVLAKSYLLDSPSWSPDGQEIAFTRCTGNGGGWLSIIRRDGTHANNVVRLPRGACVGAVAWSPDGKQLAFLTGRNTLDASLQIVNIDGSNRHTIARHLDGCCRISWQPEQR